MMRFFRCLRHERDRKWLGHSLIVLVSVLSFPAFAEDEILTIEGTRIRGNQELPTILYLVPWQGPEVQSLEAPQRSFAVQREMKPLERAEFKRFTSYHNQFKGRASEEPTE